jgi:hypothetical protein
MKVPPDVKTVVTLHSRAAQVTSISFGSGRRLMKTPGSGLCGPTPSSVT